MRFRGQLRPSQSEVVEIARRKLAEGRRRLHIVAPPGSGKTVLGLFLWAECIRRPAVVLSPNSAIQAQWAARTDLFELPAETTISTDPRAPGVLTSLTYQSVTAPRRGGDDLDAAALELWRDRLIATRQAQDPDEAQVWIDDLSRHNRDYYDSRIGAYRKQARDAAVLGGEALGMLHGSVLAALGALRERGVGLVILDECHHLLGHWGRVLSDAHELLDEPIVVGLTATPPDERGRLSEDIERYAAFFGPVDFEVPVPAVVRDGFLAPYQDLAYFVRPQAAELAFVAGADEQLHELVAELCPAEDDPAQGESSGKCDGSLKPAIEVNSTDATGSEAHRTGASADSDATAEVNPLDSLPRWLLCVLAELRLPTGKAQDWARFERRDPEFAKAARLFLLAHRYALPEDVPEPEEDIEPGEMPEMALLTPVLDRYVRHGLRRSNEERHHQLAARIIARLRTLGVQITETGSQACASPVGRVLAYSRAKAAALIPILQAELAALGDSIRAVVVSDYEKSSATRSGTADLLDEEAGGAVAAFKALLADEATDRLDPVLVTGSSVLIDDDLAEAFDHAAQEWLLAEGCDVELEFGREMGFHIVRGRGGDWCPRVYVQMVTELFQRGLTRCLVGTRGLLGEGWDANRINVLIDLTTVTTSMSVNQLRGRSFRLDPVDPQKVANNWDVVCLAPEFSKGLDDYARFIAKHKTIYGVTDDGAIEKGVGHVHAAFGELKPAGVESSMTVLNADMLRRAAGRAEARELWKIGEPYHEEPVRAVEAQLDGGGFPPLKARKVEWTSGSLAQAIGQAVLGALVEARLLAKRDLHVGERAGGFVRVFLEEATAEESQLFATALHDALGPLHRPRYVIQRHTDADRDTWLSRVLPDILGRYFRKRERRMVMLHAVPRVLAKNKHLAALFTRHWNRYVSPGQAIYAHHGEGETLVAAAKRQGQTPSGVIQEKEIFL